MEKLDIIKLSLAEAFALTRRAYEYIDTLYDEDCLKFKTDAKEFNYRNHRIARQFTPTQFAYFMKAVGLLLNNDYHSQEILNIVKKVWRYADTFLSTHKTVDFNEFGKRLAKKMGGTNKIDINDLNCHYIALLILIKANDFIDVVDNETYREFLNVFSGRFVRFEQSICLLPSKLDKELEKVFKRFRDDIEKTFNPISNIDNFAIYNSEYAINVKSYSAYLLDNNVDILNLSTESKLSIKDVNDTYLSYLLSREIGDSIDTSDVNVIEQIYLGLVIKQLAKNYESTKEYILSNNNDKLLDELKKSKDDNRNFIGQIKILGKEKEQNNITFSNLEKENKKLKERLSISEDYRHEVVALRELFFENQNKDDFEEEIERDYNSINKKKCAFVGGHTNLHNKLKKFLPDWIYIDTDNQSFDADVLSSVDTTFIYSNYIKHSVYIKAMAVINKSQLKFKYITGTNIDLILSQVFE